MIVATFIASEWEGRELSYDGCRSFAIVDGDDLEPTDVVEFDRRGWLKWASEHDRSMTFAIACLERGDLL